MTGALEAEIGQRTPLDPAAAVYLGLLRTARLLAQEQARFFRPWDLTPTQYNALRILRGSHPEPLPCSEVGERLVTPVPDVTRLLDRLGAKKLAVRRRDRGDRRVVRVGITAAGLALLAEIDEPLRAWGRERLGHLSARELSSLEELLAKARSAPGGTD